MNRRCIRVPRESLLRDYIVHESVIRREALGGIDIGGKLAGMYVENELLYVYPRHSHQTQHQTQHRKCGCVVQLSPEPGKATVTVTG